MPKYTLPMTENLLRQRRNLIIASCIIWFFHFGNVQISSLTYADIDFKINGKNSAYIAVWFFYFYAVFRFLVYFIEDGWDGFINSFTKVLDNSCIKKISHELSVKSESEILNNNFGFSFCKANMGIKGFYFIYFKESENEEVIFISYIKLFPCLLKGLLVFLFLRTALTDYVFPILLAMYVWWNSAFSNWVGSLKNIIFITGT